MSLQQDQCMIQSESDGRSPSPVPSGMSMKSQQSMAPPNNFTSGKVPDKSGLDQHKPVENNDPQQKINGVLHNIFNHVKQKINDFVNHELESYKKILKNKNTRFYSDLKEDMLDLKESVLDMTLYYLKTMEHDDVADALYHVRIGIQQCALKKNMSKYFCQVREGIAKAGQSTELNKIFTNLYITEGGVGQVNQQHEVNIIESQKDNVTKYPEKVDREKQIECQNMFEPLPEQDKPVRLVMTHGVAGIGKSICVQKFVLDWAEGKKYQDITFIFPLPFRELNLMTGSCSLIDIIVNFYPETKGLRFTDRYKFMFIFDGLDECRLPLRFQENELWTDASKPNTLDVIITNLIKGALLPSALIWITTRPAAAARIPAEYVDRVTEVRGFNDMLMCNQS